jgi:hypothetical protein
MPQIREDREKQRRCAGRGCGQKRIRRRGSSCWRAIVKAIKEESPALYEKLKTERLIR